MSVRARLTVPGRPITSERAGMRVPSVSNVPAAPQSGVGEDGQLEEPAANHPATENGGLQDAVLDAGIGLDDFEQTLLRRAVERANGNLAAAARLLGITRPQLNYRLKKQDAER